MITGLPGSGKTTFAKVIAKDLKAIHLNTEIIRIRMGKRGQHEDKTISVSYAKMLKQTESNLHKGKKVIVDATFYKAALRKPYVHLAKKYKKQLFWIFIVVNDEIIKERMQQSVSYTDEDFKRYLTLKDIYEPLEVAHLELHADRYSLEEMIAKVSAYLQLSPLIKTT